MEDARPAWSRPRRVIVKSVTLAMAVLSRTYLPFVILGLWNRTFGGWQSIFFCYAGSRNFIASYAAPTAATLFRWVPSPIGILSPQWSPGPRAGRAGDRGRLSGPRERPCVSPLAQTAAPCRVVEWDRNREPGRDFARVSCGMTIS